MRSSLPASFPPTPPPETVALHLRCSTVPPPPAAAFTWPLSPVEETIALAPVAPRKGHNLIAEKASFQEAQCLFPHDAGIFVGNLPRSFTEHQLMLAVKQAFAQHYGPCWVNVGKTIGMEHNRRVEKPWAVVQFEHNAPAQLAISQSGGIVFGTRATRVQALSANRSI